MALHSIRNQRGFFSDYWLGTLAGSRGAAGAKLSAAQARKALDRVTRLVEAAAGNAEPDLQRFRERFARPLLLDVFGFDLHENADKPRLRALSISDGSGVHGSPVALVALCADPQEIDARATRRQLEDELEACGLDHGFLLSPEVLRLVRRPGLGHRGASFDLVLATLAERRDSESLATTWRVLAAPSFQPGADGKRPIALLEDESRRHGARVSNDLKAAVFDAAEHIVGAFVQDVRGRGADFVTQPSLQALRDAGFLALYRLLFILYAEARDERLLSHRLYQRSYSLDSLVSRLLRQPITHWPANRDSLWQHLLALFRVFNDGIRPNPPDLENIPPRGGRLFSDETPEGELLRRLRLPDRATAQILLSLATSNPRRGVGRERVSFRELDIEQLGNVYQGLLDYEPAEAAETLIECSVGGHQLALTADEVVQLAEIKSLVVRGEAAVVEGTVAARLHPDAAEDGADETEDEEDDDSDADGGAGSDDEQDDAPALKRGAPLKLLRRLEPGSFYFRPGLARKASGSYYTPTPMVDYLVRESLAPLVQGKTPAEIERLRVIDIACGSAHFLVGAARFLGRALHAAYERELSGEPPPAFHPQRAPGAAVRERWAAEGPAWCKRRIVERCLFGVDLNPAAVQLAQVALWIESLAGDRPLGFFAHHIRNGNSLLGSWIDRYELVPDPQLQPLPDRHTRGLFEAEIGKRLHEALEERRLIDAPLPPEVPGDTPGEYAYKEDRLRRAEVATQQARLLLDLRSAAPFLPAIWREFPMLMSAFDLQTESQQRPWWPAFQSIRERERFFHWELEFPEVFVDTDRPGFDAVLGNPPWDKVLPSKQEFYGSVDALIGAFKGQELDRRVRELQQRHAGLGERFAAYQERAKTVARLLRAGGDFELAEARSAAAHEELAKYFVDRSLRLTAPGGATGLVVPSVFYNGDGWVGVRRWLLNEATVERFHGFENRKKIFPIDSRYKFVNLVVRKTPGTGAFTAAFMRHDVEELEVQGPQPWQVQMRREEVEQVSPETLTFLEYRSARDQEIVRKMATGRPTLGGKGTGSWGTRLFTDRAHELIFNATRDKDLFAHPGNGRLHTPRSVLGREPADFDETLERMREQGFWPVFEGKHVDQFVVGTKPIRWWLSVEQAEKKYDKPPRELPTLVFRETARNTDERTCIAALLPAHAAGSHTLTGVVAEHVDAAAATVLNSFCFDYALRMRTAGIHVSFTYILPMPVPAARAVAALPRLATVAAWQAGIQHLADERAHWLPLWQANRAVAQAYGLDADDFAHILASFPGFARKRAPLHAFFLEQLAAWRAE
ncbi:Eco57I restriction-modification methylase domain-containing protein [Pseudorhodoferax sp.]|uniref:Eco57I restriction-modification methylase domain-containing protein n=1 Tax=Pseudorhodoferax sp. TaxID=1993553 RepID=UPI002DD619D7|nr:hypothetical protein [Pseudorhodoferax sp.]